MKVKLRVSRFGRIVLAAVVLVLHLPADELIRDAICDQFDLKPCEIFLSDEGTDRADEIIYQNGTMVLLVRPKTQTVNARSKTGKKASDPVTVLAIAVDTGTRLWEIETAAIVSTSLAMDGENVLFHDGNGIVCIQTASGNRRWRTDVSGAGLSTMNTDATLVVYNDVVLCANRKQLVALSITDGHILWELPGARGFGVANPPDLFVADDLVWYGRGPAEPESISGYDPLTGELRRTVNMGPFITHGHHARCYRSKATDNYLLLPKRADGMMAADGRLYISTTNGRILCYGSRE